MNETLNQKARESLRNNSKYFFSILGEPSEEGQGLCFSLKGKTSPFSGFKIRYVIEKKFLGKIYAMVLEATFGRQKEFQPSGKIELRYSGFIRKGTPYFAYASSKKTGTDGNELLQLLNHDEDLIEQCKKLEIEFLNIFFDPQADFWTVQVRPYGGSFVHLMLPPMQYNVILVKEQADLIFSIMKRIAGLIDK
ncbi:MAG: DUF3156 family protein [Deltaproteobacteria bacterium]|nr:DUF3156 family protein [Deltaproteobacteria bacterium]